MGFQRTQPAFHVAGRSGFLSKGDTVTKNICCLTLMLLSAIQACAPAQETGVTATVAPGIVGLRVNGQPFAAYNFGPGLAKPYMEPVRAPGGHVVSALAPFDHKHHKGIYVGVEKVNGYNFWGGKYQQQDAVTPEPAAERIENVSVEVHPGENGSQQLHIHNIWQGEEGKTVVHEKTIITAFPNRLLVYDISLVAGDEPVGFEDTKEGFFAIRLAPTMIEKNGGVITNAEGDVGEKDCWGKTTAWVDYSGLVDGRPVGVALFDHPDNFRKSRYHVRGYGLFSISPFGEKSYSQGKSEAPKITLQPGEKVQVKYGLFPHAGDAEKGGVADAYAKFVEWTK